MLLSGGALEQVNAFFEFINPFIFWAGVYVLAWYGYILVCHKAVPNIKTAPAIRAEIIARLKADMEGKGLSAGGYTVIDLGCANGKFTRELARALPDATIVGIDIAHVAIWWARVVNRLVGIRNARYERRDFMGYDLRGVDAVLVYLTIFQMEEVGRKLKDELKSGALVTCNRFALGAGWEPLEVVEVDTLMPHQKVLNIYRA